MFDGVGRGHDRKRSLPAFLLALSLNGGAIGSLALLTRSVAETVIARQEPPIDQFVEIDLPKLPSPPPSDGGGARPVRRGQHAEARIIAPPSPTPVPPSPEPPRMDPGPPGVGLPGGGPGKGPGIGPGDGPGDSPGGGGGGGLKSVHWSEVRVRHRVLPDFPDAARTAGIRTATCVVLFHIDGEGVPTEVVPQTCPAAFAPSAVTAAMKWRFDPLPGHQPAKFALTLEYRTR